MPLPAWASDRIRKEVKKCLAEKKTSGDYTLDEVVRSLAAWPVYGDIGGVLLLSVDGEIYFRDNNTMELRIEKDDNWRCLAWAAAAEMAPELKAILPDPPGGVSNCTACGGSGHIRMTPTIDVWCAVCWGLGWRWPDGPFILRQRSPI